MKFERESPWLWYTKLLRAEEELWIRADSHKAAATLRGSPHCVLCGLQLCDSSLTWLAAFALNIQVAKRIDHHISYKPEEIVPVCASCHVHIHHSPEIPEVYRSKSKRPWGYRGRTRKQRKKQKMEKWRRDAVGDLYRR